MAKRFVLAALVLVMVAAAAGPALAETKVEFSGEYRTRYFYLHNRNLSDGDDGSEPTGAEGYFDQRFRLEAKFMPSDKLAFVTKLQAIYNKWGTQKSGLKWDGMPGGTVDAGVDANGDPVTIDLSEDDYDSSIEMYRAYIVYKTGIGEFEIGRTAAYANGLTLLGYDDGGAPFESVGPAQKIVWTLPMGAFTMRAAYSKVEEYDYAERFVSDGDVDRFLINPMFKWATGAFAFQAEYWRDRSDPDFDVNMYLIDPAVIQNFGPFGLHFELQYILGTKESTADGGQDIDLNGLGIYLDGVYNYGRGEAAIQGLYVSGDDDPNDDEQGGQVTSGGDFTPFLVVYDRGLKAEDISDAANHWMIGMWWNHKITEAIMLHAAAGYFSIVETPDGVDEYFGSEVDLGVKVKLTSGLSFKSLVGYYAPGDYQEDMAGGDVGASVCWKNEIKIKF